MKDICINLNDLPEWYELPDIKPNPLLPKESVEDLLFKLNCINNLLPPEVKPDDS